jgi:hypothetical protein
MCSSMHSLTSALNRGEWSASRPGRFTPRERAPGTHGIGGWVGPRAVLDTVVEMFKKKFERQHKRDTNHALQNTGSSYSALLYGSVT